MKLVPVISAEEAALWDRRAREEFAIPSRVLMESAGRAAAAVVAAELGEHLSAGVLVACGTGNNGGDGLVLARALAAHGVPTSAALAPEDATADRGANRVLAQAAGVRMVGPEEEWGPCGVAVDALVGTGARGALRGAVAAMAERLMRQGAKVAAVDGPSGLDLTTGQVHEPCVRATLTVTFGAFRRGHLLQRSLCGTIVATDIGFPPADPAWPVVVGDAWLREVLPPLGAEMHKGERGRVLVVGGAEGMAGAAIFAAKAALRSGAGLVRLAASEASVRAAQAAAPDLVCLSVVLAPPLSPALLEALEWADALILGPGLGRGPERDDFARAVLGAGRSPVLLDADGLIAFRAAPRDLGPALAGRVALLTPHRGEFAALFPDLADGVRRDPFAAARAAAERLGQTVLLKGVPTVVAAPQAAAGAGVAGVAGETGGRLLVSASGNPGLATGGTGDVLAGMAASWLARGVSPEVAGAAAAHAHGRAAEDVARHRSVRTLRPDDLLGVLSPLWRSLVESPPPLDPPVLARLDAPAVH